MEAVLEQREKTLSEIAHDVYTETGSYFAAASIFCFLKRNSLSLKGLSKRFVYPKIHLDLPILPFGLVF